MTSCTHNKIIIHLVYRSFRNKQLAMLKKENRKKRKQCVKLCHKMGNLANCCSEWLKVRECWALEQSDDRQVSRLRGKKSDGRHRKTGRQVNISDGDRPQRTLCLLHSCLSENTYKVLTVHFSTQQDIHYQGTGEPVCEVSPKGH